MYIHIGLIAALIAVALRVWRLVRPQKKKLFCVEKKHVCITGGSAGIGAALAKVCVSKGARIVSLVARNSDALEAVKKELCIHTHTHTHTQGNTQTHTHTQRDAHTHTQRETHTHTDTHTHTHTTIVCVPLDVTDEELTDARLNAIAHTHGSIDILFNCAGVCVPDTLEDLSAEECHTMIDLNLKAPMFIARNVIPNMKKKRFGMIINVNSQAGQIGLYGFSGYAASKFGLRGFSEALNMELKMFNVRVMSAYPPATATPGFELEEQRKPEITRSIEGMSGVLSAECVASKIVADAERGAAVCVFGLNGYFLSIATAAITPSNGVFATFAEVLLAGPVRLVGVILQLQWDRLVRNAVRTTS